MSSTTSPDQIDVAASYRDNRIANCHNGYQGDAKRVLCVCSAGLLRSPTAAWVLSNEPYNFNTRAAGIVPQYALIPVDEVLVEWADEIVCMTDIIRDGVVRRFQPKCTVYDLEIPDNFSFKHPRLIDLIRERYNEIVLKEKA